MVVELEEEDEDRLRRTKTTRTTTTKTMTTTRPTTTIYLLSEAKQKMLSGLARMLTGLALLSRTSGV